MLTEEQIKNLKPGDKLLVEAYFVEEKDGYHIKCSLTPPYAYESRAFSIISSLVSLPSEYKTVVDARDVFRNMSEGEKACINNFLASYFRESKKQEEMRNSLKKMGIDLTNIQPKHDPNRKFKKGDRAQVVERNGRNVTCFPVGRIKVGDIVTVAENETVDVFIKVITEDGHEMMAPWFMLKLVTPVEELEPYKLIDSPNTYNIVRDSATVITIHKKSHPNAKAAAEAERDRLNTEYRKEQNND